MAKILVTRSTLPSIEEYEKELENFGRADGLQMQVKSIRN